MREGNCAIAPGCRSTCSTAQPDYFGEHSYELVDLPRASSTPAVGEWNCAWRAARIVSVSGKALCRQGQSRHNGPRRETAVEADVERENPAAAEVDHI